MQALCALKLSFYKFVFLNIYGKIIKNPLKNKPWKQTPKSYLFAMVI